MDVRLGIEGGVPEVIMVIIIIIIIIIRITRSIFIIIIVISFIIITGIIRMILIFIILITIMIIRCWTGKTQLLEVDGDIMYRLTVGRARLYTTTTRA